jgi:hypothetical protein
LKAFARIFLSHAPPFRFRFRCLQRLAAFFFQENMKIPGMARMAAVS